MLSSLFWHLSAFLSGLLFSSLLNFSASAWWSWLLLIFTLLLRKKKNYSLFFLLLTFFSLGCWRGQSVPVINENLQKYFNQTQVWDFWVCADPEPDWSRQITTLCPLSSSFTNDFTQEKVLANLPIYPQVRYGDKLQIKCCLEAAPIFPDFNYAAYLAAHGITAICSWPQVVELDSAAEGKAIMRKLYQAKRLVLHQINSSLPEPEAGLASALLLGYKKTLYKTEEENFQQAGLSHIVAISGGHISLFIELLIMFLVYLGLSRNLAIWPALGAATFYVLLTGVQASAWRSLIMGAIMIYAWRRGRLSSAWGPLLLAATIMLWFNPELWQQDLGFQLSFLAISGMIIFHPIFSRYFENIKNKYLYMSANAFSLSLSAQLTVWPLLAIKSGGISLIAPLTNVFAFAIFGPLVLFLLGAIGVNLIIAHINLAWLGSYQLLHYLLILARLSIKLPGAYLKVPGFKSIYAFLYYFILLLFLIFYYRQRRQQKKRGNYPRS